MFGVFQKTLVGSKVAVVFYCIRKEPHQNPEDWCVSGPERDKGV